MEATDAEFHSQHRAALREMALGSAHKASGNAARQGDRNAALGGSNFEAAD
jgi:hypothetical protein